MIRNSINIQICRTGLCRALFDTRNLVRLMESLWTRHIKMSNSPLIHPSLKNGALIDCIFLNGESQFGNCITTHYINPWDPGVSWHNLLVPRSGQILASCGSRTITVTELRGPKGDRVARASTNRVLMPSSAGIPVGFQPVCIPIQWRRES